MPPAQVLFGESLAAAIRNYVRTYGGERGAKALAQDQAVLEQISKERDAEIRAQCETLNGWAFAPGVPGILTQSVVDAAITTKYPLPSLKKRGRLSHEGQVLVSVGLLRRQVGDTSTASYHYTPEEEVPLQVIVVHDKDAYSEEVLSHELQHALDNQKQIPPFLTEMKAYLLGDYVGKTNRIISSNDFTQFMEYCETAYHMKGSMFNLHRLIHYLDQSLSVRIAYQEVIELTKTAWEGMKRSGERGAPYVSGSAFVHTQLQKIQDLVMNPFAVKNPIQQFDTLVNHLTTNQTVTLHTNTRAHLSGLNALFDETRDMLEFAIQGDPDQASVDGVNDSPYSDLARLLAYPLLTLNEGVLKTRMSTLTAMGEKRNANKKALALLAGIEETRPDARGNNARFLETGIPQEIGESIEKKENTSIITLIDHAMQRAV